MSFVTIPGAKQHKKSHTTEFVQALVEKLPAPEFELMEKLAQIEAQSINVQFVAKMAAATALSKYQIRHGREKPGYKKYHEHARYDLASSAKSRFGSTNPSVNQQESPPDDAPVSPTHKIHPPQMPPTP